jgi:cold-inducible RNA-binding protein
MKNLFVGNMSFQTTEADLRAAFEQYGEITRIQIMTDRDTGRARGFAFVEMADEQAAANAIAGLNGKELDGRALNVNEAKPKPERSGGGGGGGRGGYGGGGGGGRRDSRW